VSKNKQPYNKRFLRELSELREEALQNSHWKGVRRKIGKISIGAVEAAWFGETGDSTRLTDAGLRIGQYSPSLLLSPRWLPPTNLYIFDHSGSEDRFVTQFSMDLDPRRGFIDAYHYLISPDDNNGSLAGVMNKESERRVGIPPPTEEELALLRTEMEIGANGKFKQKVLNG
jgi:hypothetical protein